MCVTCSYICLSGGNFSIIDYEFFFLFAQEKTYGFLMENFGQIIQLQDKEVPNGKAEAAFHNNLNQSSIWNQMQIPCGHEIQMDLTGVSVTERFAKSSYGSTTCRAFKGFFPTDNATAELS